MSCITTVRYLQYVHYCPFKKKEKTRPYKWKGCFIVCIPQHITSQQRWAQIATAQVNMSLNYIQHACWSNVTLLFDSIAAAQIWRNHSLFVISEQLNGSTFKMLPMTCLFLQRTCSTLAFCSLESTTDADLVYNGSSLCHFLMILLRSGNY